MLPVKDWWMAIVAVAVAVLLALLAQALFPDKAEPATSQTLCMDDETRIIVRRIALEGLDAGLKAHAQKLFEGWIKDHVDQPKRASAGMQEALHIYGVARNDMLTWNPSNCGGPK